VNGCVIDVFDHKHLNDFFSNPTAEVITKDIKERLTSVLPAGIKVHRIKLWENHKSYAIYRRNS
jgi:6-pyruvoyl-tetrahydropterin synthase